jgi:tight adherence protein B
MTSAWLALAAAVMLMPLPATARVRARALAVQAPRARSRPTTTWPGWSAAPGALAACAVVVVTLSGGLVLGVAAGAIGLAGSRLIADARARRRRLRSERDLLAAVRLLVAEVESGARADAALAAAAEVAPDHAAGLGAAGRAAADGVDVAPALLGEPALIPLGQAWRVAGAVGAPLAEVLSGVAQDLAARADQARAVAVALSAVRSTATLLSGLPLVGIGLGAAMGAAPLAFLVQSPGGQLVCCVGVVLDLIGLLWTQRLARRAESS